MSAKEIKPGAPGTKPPRPASGGAGGAVEATGVGNWKSTERTVRRSFPGPRGASALLRVTADRRAYAELIAHAKESLDAEICGVLAGTLCEDDQGYFLHVEALIRGTAASQGSTHVTFTQETWNGIHTVLEKDHPKLRIVGWYHSHPGFGVEFSEMDLFIQRNFFSSPTQIALVIDPLSGAVAICLNTPEGIAYLDKYWVEGREQPCQIPKGQAGKTSSSAVPAGPPENAEALRTLEARLDQLIQAVDEQREAHGRFLLICGLVVCLAAIGAVGYSFYSSYRYRNEAPKVTQFVPVPIKVGDKTVLMGVGVLEWQVPEELNAAYVELERQSRLAAETAKEEAAKAAADAQAQDTNAPGTNTTAPADSTNTPSQATNKPSR
jgi:proteasome lid subunit RPN8/RPN11